VTHLHSKTCTFEVCGVGPTRASLVRATLLGRLERGDSFMHYKRSEVEAMRFAPSELPATARVGNSVRADSPSRTNPTPTGAGRHPFPLAGASEDVAP